MNVPKFADFERIVFFTGAGLSAESGIATYRGVGGTWSQYNYKEYACQDAFELDPQKVWDFHDKRRVEALNAPPNRGHEIIAEVQRLKPNTTVITQNIDGILNRVGCKDVIELHGSLWRVRCTCGVEREDLSAPISSRSCECGEILRPDIVWFGDWLDSKTLRTAKEALATCDLLVSVGTSGNVFPAADLPRRVAEEAMTVEVNPQDTPMSYMYKHHLRGSATEMLSLMNK